jgi:hypothetical protein
MCITLTDVTFRFLGGSLYLQACDITQASFVINIRFVDDVVDDTVYDIIL